MQARGKSIYTLLGRIGKASPRKEKFYLVFKEVKYFDSKRLES